MKKDRILSEKNSQFRCAEMSTIQEHNLSNPKLVLSYNVAPSLGEKKVRIEFKPSQYSWSQYNFSHCLALVRQVFLPEGFPESVSDDYVEYQIWDTIQAFASSITGALATKAVMQGVGVGDQNATALAATLTWLIKDGTGMIGRIVFAWLKGQDLDYECKKWRFVADILNDGALTLELVAPYFPGMFTPIVCTAGVAKSIVGVAGGATRAALTQHQARRDNLADVSAKDGSQETLVNLMALLTSLWLLPLIADSAALTWMVFLPLTLLHLFANYRAVRGIRMPTLNRSRLMNIINHRHSTKEVLAITECNRTEHFLQPASMLEKRWFGREIKFGASLSTYIANITSEEWSNILQPQLSKHYAIIGTDTVIAVFLSSSSTPAEMVMAYTLALMLSKDFHSSPTSDLNKSVPKSLKWLEEVEWPKLKEALIGSGWNVLMCQLSPGPWRYADRQKTM